MEAGSFLETARKSLRAVLNYSAARDYSGYSKFDALNSPFLETLFGWNYLGRLLAIQAVNRFPLPIRPILGVRQSRNPKGVANFIKAYGNLHCLEGRPEDLAAAENLGRWLLENHSNRSGAYHGLCWGYNFPWQSPGFFAPRHSPNCIVTVFCAEGLLSLHRETGRSEYLAGARSAADFILQDLPVLEDDGRKKCIGYVPVGLRWKVININSVAAGFLSKLARAAGESRLLDEAEKMIRWTAENRTDYFAWPYTVPASASGIGHDNYHTGGILDGILDFLEASGRSWPEEVFERGLEFYQKRLFEPDGAPRLTSQKRYPHDIHGSAQGILTFARAAARRPEHLDLAVKIARWAIENMQAPDGRFYYRRHRFFTRRECLMRWNNSWMAWALSELALRLNDCRMARS